MTSTRMTKPRRHAVGAKGSAVVTKPVRHIAGPTGETKGAADPDDMALSAPLECDVDSEEGTQLEAIFEEPLHVDDDDAIIDDADSTGSRRR